MLKSLKDLLKVSLGLAPAVVSATGAGAGFDVSNFGALTFVINVGATSGNDFSASHKLDIVMQHADVDTDGSYADCADADIFNAENGASGIVKSLDATSDASAVHLAHYRGQKRYVRIRLVETGTVSVPIGIIAIGGYGKFEPAL